MYIEIPRKGLITAFIKIDKEDFSKVKNIKWYIHVGYAYNRKHGFMHRYILGLSKGDSNVDHINGDTFDNSKKNLRVCSQRFNTKNGSKHKDGSSKYKGVHFYKLTGKWRAQICVDYKTKSLGLFETQIEAAEAYNLAAKKYHKQFARLNKIER